MPFAKGHLSNVTQFSWYIGCTDHIKGGFISNSNTHILFLSRLVSSTCNVLILNLDNLPAVIMDYMFIIITGCYRYLIPCDSTALTLVTVICHPVFDCPLSEKQLQNCRQPNLTNEECHHSKIFA